MEYRSISLTNMERRNDTTKREGLAIVWAVLQLHLYLENSRSTMWTDHDSHKRVPNLKTSARRITGWNLILSEYEFDVVHRTEIKLQAADVLSRLQTTQKDRKTLEEDLPELAIDVTNNEEDISIVDADSEYISPLNAEASATDNTSPRKEEMIIE